MKYKDTFLSILSSYNDDTYRYLVSEYIGLNGMKEYEYGINKYNAVNDSEPDSHNNIDNLSITVRDLKNILCTEDYCPYYDGCKGKEYEKRSCAVREIVNSVK